MAGQGKASGGRRAPWLTPTAPPMPVRDETEEAPNHSYRHPRRGVDHDDCRTHDDRRRPAPGAHTDLHRLTPQRHTSPPQSWQQHAALRAVRLPARSLALSDREELIEVVHRTVDRPLGLPVEDALDES